MKSVAEECRSVAQSLLEEIITGSRVHLSLIPCNLNMKSKHNSKLYFRLKIALLY